jgi:hypothetical protein
MGQGERLTLRASPAWAGSITRTASSRTPTKTAAPNQRRAIRRGSVARRACLALYLL